MARVCPRLLGFLVILYGSVFIRLAAVLPPKMAKSREIPTKYFTTAVQVIQGHQSRCIVPESELNLTVGSNIIQPVKSVRDLGVQLDTELSMNTHVSKVASSCFYQLRRLRQIRRFGGQEVAAQLVSAFILSQLDYCNSALASLSRCTTEPLQCALNGAARLVLNLCLCDQVTPALQQVQLHWLLIEYRITYVL